MCGPAVGAGLQIASTVAGQYAAEKQSAEQGKAAVTQMNYQFQNYELERQDAFDQSVAELTKVRMNAMGLNASVDAAINEDYSGGGRTADLLKRSVRGDELRTTESIKENYKRKSNEINLNKETTLNNTKETLKGLKPPSRIGAAIGIASSVLGGYTQDQNNRAEAKTKGVKYSSWRGTY